MRDELARAEADFTGVRLAQLTRIPLPGAYDLPHLQAFHRPSSATSTTGPGEIRTVAIGRGTGFCRPEHIAGDAEELFAWLARTDHLSGLDREVLVDGLTGLLSDLNALHPFREGNGRTQRAFVAQLARDAGHPVQWARMDPAENVTASRASHAGDDGPLRVMLDKLTS